MSSSLTAVTSNQPVVAPQGPLVRSELRDDIQALRGIAILLVLIYHSKLLPSLKAGYLGVDVFFVVSGFLITGIVRRQLMSGRFSFSDFYARRAKRLLPAAYVTLLATVIAAPIFLTSSEMGDFLWQLIGALTLTGNIALWMQTGYFEGAAHLKPLLHVWSLSIEEQYYLVLPALLVVIAKRFWTIAAVAVCLSSLLLCLWMVPIKPGASFYLLPTRAWELALGSLGAIALDGTSLGRLLGRLFWLALIALVLVPFFPTGAPHPGMDALIVCVATLIIILRRHPLADGLWCLRPLVWFGNISYSLYLVHWPLLAFAQNAWVSPSPGLVRLGLIVLGCGLAWVLFRYVEQPVRVAAVPVTGGITAAVLAVSLAILLAGYFSATVIGRVEGDDFAFRSRANVGLSPSCEYYDTFSPDPACQTNATPRIMVWGDSYAMHLVEGIRASTRDGILQATRTTCGPFLGMSLYADDGFYNRDWARKCVRFNDDVLSYLEGQQSVDVVVLSSLYSQYLPDSQVLWRDPNESANGGGLIETIATQDAAVGALRATVEAIRAIGKRVVIVAPPPAASGVDFGRCIELRDTGRLVMGADNPSCAISEHKYRLGRAPVQALLDRVASEADVAVFDFDEFLCDGNICLVEKDGHPLYRDSGHLSYDGSRLLGEELQLAERLRELAR